jgi:hypothetical protein
MASKQAGLQLKSDFEIRLMLSPARVQKLAEGPTHHEKTTHAA